MDSQSESVVEVESVLVAHAGAWIQSVIGLLGKASQHLGHSREAAQSAIEEATSLLQEQVRPRSRTPARASGGLLAWQVRKVRDYVDVHLTGRVLVSDLSAIVQLSDGHFSRAFKVSTGRAPGEWLLELRIARAKDLLRTSDRSLADIADHCGFADQSHFTRTFSRRVGQAPGTWRRNHRRAVT